MQSYINYDTYLNNRKRSKFKDLFIKLFLAVNSSLIFHNGLRVYFYKLLGVHIPKGITGIFIARGVLLDDNFPEMITIEEGAVLSWNVLVICHDALNEHNRFISPVLIKRKAVVGARSIILPGVTIGEHAIIGAGSVVTKDIPANTTYAGVPARLIRENKKATL